MALPVNREYWKGRISTTVDLLVLTSLDKLLFMLKILFIFATKQAILIRRSTILSLPLQLVIPTVSIIIYYCDNDIVSQSNSETLELNSIERMACLSDNCLNFDALWVKVMRTLISPELVWTSYNSTLSLCCHWWNVTSLSLSRISTFKRSK